MSHGPAPRPSSDTDLLTQKIAKVVADIAERLEAGEDVDMAAIGAKHPDLLPELETRLRHLAMIVDARKRVQTQAQANPTDAERRATAETELLQEALSSYRILALIFRGGQGAIYKAVDPATKRLVAVKVLAEGPLATERQRLRFAREIALTARLKHPHIVTVFHSGAVRDRLFYVMAYVQGMPITDHAVAHGLTARERVALFATVVRAANHAHQRGIIHRDLKPSNILVDEDGQPQILDFGLAKAINQMEEETDQDVSVFGTVVGTLPYISPEQASGLDDLDIRSDVYSLAVVLFELITGEFPYSVEGDRKEVRNRIRSQPPQPLRTALQGCGNDGYPSPGEISDDLEAVMARALAKDPADRYQSADVFANDLERYLRGEAVEARADSGLYVFRKTLRRYRVPISIAAAFALVLIGSSIAVTRSWIHASRERDNARQVARVAHRTLDQVVTEIDESIRPLPGGIEVRDRLLGGVAASLEVLEPLVIADVTLEDVAVALHEKQGDIALAEGRLTEAGTHYEACLNATPPANENLSDARASALREVRVLRKYANVTDNPTEVYGRAMAAAEGLLHRWPENEEAALVTAELHIDRARHRVRIGRYEEAAQDIEAVDHLVSPRLDRMDADRRWLLLLGSAREWESDIKIKLGDGRAARTAMEQSLSHRLALFARRPYDVVLKNRLVLSYSRLGEMQWEEGSAEDAVVSFDRAVELGNELVAAEPSVTEWKRSLQRVHERMATLYLNANDLDRAEEHCRRATQLISELRILEPTNSFWKRLDGFSLRTRSRIHLARHMYEDALVELHAEMALREELAASQPNDPRLMAELAMTCDDLGHCLRLLDRQAEALDAYERALVMRTTLVGQQPEVIEHSLDVILSQMKLATWHLSQRTATADAAAENLIIQGQNMLNQLDEDGRLEGRQRTLNEWSAAMRQNLNLIAKRQARRATEATQSDTQQVP